MEMMWSSGDVKFVDAGSGVDDLGRLCVAPSAGMGRLTLTLSSNKVIGTRSEAEERARVGVVPFISVESSLVGMDKSPLSCSSNKLTDARSGDVGEAGVVTNLSTAGLSGVDDGGQEGAVTNLLVVGFFSGIMTTRDVFASLELDVMRCR